MTIFALWQSRVTAFTILAMFDEDVPIAEISFHQFLSIPLVFTKSWLDKVKKSKLFYQVPLRVPWVASNCHDDKVTDVCPQDETDGCTQQERIGKKVDGTLDNFLECLSKRTKDIIWTGDFARERAFLDIYIRGTKSINLSVAKIRLDEWFPSWYSFLCI